MKELPENTSQSAPVPSQDIYTDPPLSSDPSMIQFYGCRKVDEAHCLYTIPATTPISDIVEIFEIGSHNALDKMKMIRLVADKATQISSIIPCHVIFADAAGLKLKFHRRATKADVTQIEALFSEDDGDLGLEYYYSIWDGVNSIFFPIIEEGLFFFWWD